MPIRISDKRIERILRQVHEREEAKHSVAGRLWPNLIPTEDKDKSAKPPTPKSK
jgi:hypothetical protein